MDFFFHLTIMLTVTLLLNEKKNPFHIDMLYAITYSNVLQRNVEIPYRKWIIGETS